LGIFLFTIVSRTALRPTQTPIQWVPGFLSLGIKRPGREVGHSPPSSAEVKNAWSYTSTPTYVFVPWGLVKHRDNFIFYCTVSLWAFMKMYGSWNSIIHFLRNYICWEDCFLVNLRHKMQFLLNEQRQNLNPVHYTGRVGSIL